MISEQLMPALSPTMEEGSIAKWHVKPGDQVAEGDVIAEVQTDKTVVEWEALESGYVGEIIIPEGENAQVNMVALLLTSEKGEDLGDAVDQAKAKNAEMSGGGGGESGGDQSSGDESASEAAQPAAPEPSASAAKPPPAPAPAPAPSAAKSALAAKPAAAPRLAPSATVRVSPVAARIARERGLDLAALQGTGTDGRIVRRDVEAALANGNGTRGGKAAAGNPFLARGGAGHEDVGLSQMRQVIGKRLLESKQQIPHFYITERIDARALVDLRAQLNAIEGVKITFNDLVTKAVALTLIRHPDVNSTFHGNMIRRYGTADISIAVAIPEGLITPILRGAEGLTLSQINAGVKDLAKRATAGQLKPEEYQGGSFTISNLGMYGIEEFAAIINPPQTAILAVGGIKDEPIVEDGAVVPGRTMRLTLSGDHRVVDGAVGAAFMKDLRELLENPGALML